MERATVTARRADARLRDACSHALVAGHASRRLPLRSGAFEVDAPAALDALDCNCSICRMGGFRHLIVPASRFRVMRGHDALTEYTFNTGTAKHYFCRRCGIKSFYIPRSHPDGFDVNVHCLDPGTIAAVNVSLFDDADRDAATAAIAHLSRMPDDEA